MATWKNLDTLDSFGKLKELKKSRRHCGSSVW